MIYLLGFGFYAVSLAAAFSAGIWFGNMLRNKAVKVVAATLDAQPK